MGADLTIEDQGPVPGQLIEVFRNEVKWQPVGAGNHAPDNLRPVANIN